MDAVGIVLIAAGAVAVVVGLLQMRGPRAAIRHLDETEANLARYETWRGKQLGVEADGPTGADVMRQQMRQRLTIWAVVSAAGVASIVIGLVVA